MNELERQEIQERMHALAITIGDALEEIYGKKMGFFMLATHPGDSSGTSDYVSNLHPGDRLNALKSTAERFEANEVIPATQVRDQ